MSELNRARAVNLELRAAIVRSGQKQVEVARALGMKPVLLCERLSGRTGWRVRELFAIADIVGVPLAEIISAADRTVERVAS